MIKRFFIKNFKSLADFSIPLGKFSCLIGMNGAGKTTVLQALDFIGHLACGITDFRGWEKNEVITIGSGSRTLEIQVDFAFDDPEEEISWSGKYNIDRQKFTEELIQTSQSSDSLFLNKYLSLKENRLFYDGMVNTIAPKDISDYNYKGSVLSAFKFDDPVICAAQKELQSLKSLELLSPNLMRKGALPNTDLGTGGDGLAGFLSKLNENDAAVLAATLREFYPFVDKYEIKRKKFGWKNLLIREAAFKSPISSAHINDGYLRILAILSQKFSKAGFLLFDEIENGINQELIEKMLVQLQNFNGKQVLVTTHSALVLNYLTDEAAKESVVLLFKDPMGHTHAVKFFEIPKIAKQIEFMAPGQIMSQTNLIELSSNLAAQGEVK